MFRTGDFAWIGTDGSSGVKILKSACTYTPMYVCVTHARYSGSKKIILDRLIPHYFKGTPRSCSKNFDDHLESRARHRRQRSRAPEGEAIKPERALSLPLSLSLCESEDLHGRNEQRKRQMEILSFSGASNLRRIRRGRVAAVKHSRNIYSMWRAVPAGGNVFPAFEGRPYTPGPGVAFKGTETL